MRTASFFLPGAVLPTVLFLWLPVPAGPRAGEVSPSPAPSPVSIASPLSSPAPDSTPAEDAIFIDHAHGWTSSFLTDQVFRFDSWFGDLDTLESEIDKPWVRVRLGVDWQEQGKFEFKNEFRAVIPLPLLNKKLGTYIGSNSDNEYGDDQDYFDSEDPNTESKVSAGLKYLISETRDFRFNTDLGVRLTLPPVLYIKPRLQYTASSGSWLFRFIQYFFYYTDDGFGETSKVEINHFLGSRFLLRSYSRATYSNTSQGVDLDQEFDLQYLNFDVRHGVNYAASLEWETAAHTWPSFKADEHHLTLRLYRSVWRPWLRLGLAPRLTWARSTPDDDRDLPDDWKKASPSLLFIVEVLFEEGDPFSADKYNPHARLPGR